MEAISQWGFIALLTATVVWVLVSHARARKSSTPYAGVFSVLISMGILTLGEAMVPPAEYFDASVPYWWATLYFLLGANAKLAMDERRESE